VSLLPMVEQGKLFTSFSQLKTFLACPRRFEFKHVRGLTPEFIPVVLVFGIAWHSALARYFGGLLNGGAAPSREVLEQTFSDSLQQQFEGKVPVRTEDDEEPGQLIDLGTKMLGAFHAYASRQQFTVEAVEVPFTAELFDPETGEVLDEHLVGIFDLVLREGERRVIVEHKSSGKKYSQDQLDFDPQLSCYAFAARQLGWEKTGLRFLVTTKTKSPAVQTEDVVRGPLSENDFLRTVGGVLKAIDAGVSYPVRGWQCRGCPYRVPCETLKGAS
jgi:CRISPR/Cas system-associated exonuclease Cas4 (RecB family)